MSRAIWEGDPGVSFSQIAEILGCSKSAVSMQAARNDWARRPTPETIAAQAQAAADSRFEQEQKERTAQSADHAPAVLESGPDAEPTRFRTQPIRPTAVVPDTPEGVSEEAARQVAVDTAVARRAELLNTHRKEWVAVRNLAYASIKSKDMEQAKHVKVVAESLKIVQDGERKAWGLDTDEKKPPSVQVTINRRAGVTIGH
ncbi:hypothetical protein DIE23_28115 [Burkholderia sp. Bp9143]|uniref:hypothetical protein n=1 Tax=Burkholderia sp. Bp9143 TaxID=2184574 RepID=UPI000F5B161B|nr:hypothetical protein [Burkholderia sp. Bp9143]RQR26930.1 hypothetical protein DIE23_28115 [Burkholderia sp. Bp9143]